MTKPVADHKDHPSWVRFDFFPFSVEDPETYEELDCFIGYYWSPGSRGTFVDGMLVTPHEPAEIAEIAVMDADGYFSRRLSEEYAEDDDILDACLKHDDNKSDY